MSSLSPRWGLRLGLVLVAAPLAAVALAVAIARWAPVSDALNRLYAGLLLGVLASCSCSACSCSPG